MEAEELSALIVRRVRQRNVHWVSYLCSPSARGRAVWSCPVPYVLPSQPSSGGDLPGPPGQADLLLPPLHHPPPGRPTPGRPSEIGNSQLWLLTISIQLKPNFWESSRKWDRSSIIRLTSSHIILDEEGSQNVSQVLRVHYHEYIIMSTDIMSTVKCIARASISEVLKYIFLELGNQNHLSVILHLV